MFEKNVKNNNKHFSLKRNSLKYPITPKMLCSHAFNSLLRFYGIYSSTMYSIFKIFCNNQMYFIAVLRSEFCTRDHLMLNIKIAQQFSKPFEKNSISLSDNIIIQWKWYAPRILRGNYYTCVTRARHLKSINHLQ